VVIKALMITLVTTSEQSAEDKLALKHMQQKFTENIKTAADLYDPNLERRLKECLSCGQSKSDKQTSYEFVVTKTNVRLGDAQLVVRFTLKK